MRKRKKILIAAVSILLIALLAGGTMAAYTKEATARNVITASNVKIDLILQEEDDAGNKSDAPASIPVLPGHEVSRIASGKNIGNEPFYVRVKAELIFTDKDGNTKTLPADGDIQLTGINTADWTEKDGFYYYGAAVEPGETTKELFKVVKFDPAIGSEYSGGNVKLHVEFQATQAANNGDSALEAKGWPA